MYKHEKSIFNLVPEISLLEALPFHLRKRFTHALKLMHENLAEYKTWEQIAAESAISSYHFHRQFTELFNETPGQYLLRLRLQVAVNFLLNNEPLNVMDIALYCGFSSSQALGKALKRELDLTAKQIRKMGEHSTPSETINFIAKLAHPGPLDSLETELANAMPTEIVWYPQRGMKKLSLSNSDWDAVFEQYGKKSTRLLGATKINQLHKSWEQIDTLIGDWQKKKAFYDFVIPEGFYLCSDVYLNSDVAYCSALEALFNIVEQQNLEIEEQGFLLEIVRDIEITPTGGVTFAFQIPIRMV